MAAARCPDKGGWASSGPVYGTVMGATNGTGNCPLNVTGDAGYTILAGQNSAPANTGVIINAQATALGGNSLAGGNSSTTNSGAGFSVTLGAYSQTWASGAVTLGYYSQAGSYTTLAYGTAIGAYAGSYAYGQTAIASGEIASVGDAQYTITNLSATTTTATQTTLYPNPQSNSSLGFGIKLCGSGNTTDWKKTMVVKGTVMGRRTDVPGTDSAWSFQGVLRGNGSSAYTWVGGSAPSATLIAQDSAASGWAVAVSASGATLTVQVTGEASNTINWNCVLETYEVRG